MNKCISVFIVSLIIFSGCSRKYFNSSAGDLIHIGGNSYISCDVILPDIGIVEGEIIKTQKRVLDNKEVNGYVLKDGDSFNLKKGTPIYRVSGYGQEEMVAAKCSVDNYVIYINEKWIEEIKKDLREDIENATALKVSSISGNNIKQVNIINKPDIIEKIMQIVNSTNKYSGDNIDKYNKFYYLEFLVMNNKNIYKPCIRFLYRTDGENGVIFDDTIKSTGFIFNNIIFENY